MLKEYFKITIEETSRDNLRKPPQFYHAETTCAKSLPEVKDCLRDRYGKVPGGRHKIYIDDKDGHPCEVGFTHSFWNKDCSHNSNSWYQTDWITIEHIVAETVLIHKGV